MSGRSFSRHRLVRCRRCGRPIAAHAEICPHCDHHRAAKRVRVSRMPVGAMLVVLLVLLAIGGYLF